jgi:hypothetical protein
LPKDYFFFVAFLAAFLAGAFLAAFFVAMLSILPFFDLHRICNTSVAVTEGIWFLKNSVKKKMQFRMTLLGLRIEKINAPCFGTSLRGNI